MNDKAKKIQRVYRRRLYSKPTQNSYGGNSLTYQQRVQIEMSKELALARRYNRIEKNKQKAIRTLRLNKFIRNHKPKPVIAYPSATGVLYRNKNRTRALVLESNNNGIVPIRIPREFLANNYRNVFKPASDRIIYRDT